MWIPWLGTGKSSILKNTVLSDILIKTKIEQYQISIIWARIDITVIGRSKIDNTGTWLWSVENTIFHTRRQRIDIVSINLQI